MHSRQSLTSSKLPIAIEQPDLSMSGQVPTSQSTDPSESLPHVLDNAASSLPLAFWIAASVFMSVWQFVDGGSLPATTAPWHFTSAFVRACTYWDADFAMVALHFTGSAWATPECAETSSSPKTNDTTTEKTRVELMGVLLER